MRKIKLGKRGLSPLVAVIVLLTLVMVLGAIIAGTLSGAPKPVLPATTAVNLAAPKGGNPAAGDTILVIRHEYGAVIDDAWIATSDSYIVWHEMKLLVNGEVVAPIFISGTSNGVEAEQSLVPYSPELSAFAYMLDTYMLAGMVFVNDFALGDQIWIELPEGQELQSSDLIQLVWEPRDLMLVEYLVQ